MKAIVLEKFGSINDLLYKDVDIPQPGPGEILIKVHFAAVNPYDQKVTEVYGRELRISLPVILGSELSGIVEKTGEGVTLFKKGDAVCGNLATFGGGLAQLAVAKETDVVHKPETVSFEVAAAAPVAALTAWKAVLETAQLKAGQKVLIQGGAGNVGSMAVQLAKRAGAYVIATASGKNKQRVIELGADEFIDYTTQDFTELVKDADAVIDIVGGKTQDESFKVLKPGGILVSLIKPPSKELVAQYKVNALMVFGGPVPERLQKIMAMISAGELKVFIERIFPLSEAKEALELVKTGHAGGKVLLNAES